MQFDVVTAFPGMLESPLSFSIVRRAQDRGLITVRMHDLRNYSTDRHRKVDDTPYGGGGGMILMPAPLFAAVESIAVQHPATRSRTVLFCPQGATFDQKTAQRLAGYDRLILICGRYEGVDERVREHLADEAISIGDYVLTGGEIPALVVIDAVARLQPGALGDQDGAANDSFANGLWIILITQNQQSSGAGRFRTFSCPGITDGSPHGAAMRHASARQHTVRT